MSSGLFKVTFASPPIPWQDILDIEHIVRDTALVYAPFEDFNGASLRTYLLEEHQFGATFHAVLDRNILTQLVHVAKGNKITNPTQKASCALLALFQLANVLIEPGVGIIEYRDSSITADAADELSYLRAFDNVHPQLVADLVLGRTDRFDTSLLDLQPQKPPAYSSGNELNEWRLQYCFALKIATLQRTRLSLAKKLSAFTRWMWQSFTFGAAAHTFAGVCFSQKFKNLLKGIGCNDIDRALRGIRNAPWDLTILQFFASNAVNRLEKDPLYLFCTHDRALRFMATLLTTESDAVDMERHFLRVTSGRLLPRECKFLADEYLELTARLDDPSRESTIRGTSEEVLLRWVQLLEEEFKRQFVNTP